MSIWRTSLITLVRETVRDGLSASLALFRVTVPVSIVVKLLNDAGFTTLLGQALAPVMEVVGLPGSMGMVWATGMVTNIYGGLVVYVTVAPQEVLTVAQVTVLGVMMLAAHSLPVELRIARMAGIHYSVMLSVRLGGAFLLGSLLHRIYLAGDWLSGPVRILMPPLAAHTSWGDWALREVRSMVIIALIITVLMLLMRILERSGLMRLLCRMLEPPLRWLGMTVNAAPITVIGMMMGVSYGGALILQEARSGRMDARDIFLALTLMGLCHSLFEDTMLMALIGGHLSGLLFARLGFALLVIFLAARLLRRIPEQFFRRFICSPPN